MKRVIMVAALFLGVLSVPVQTNARKDVETQSNYPNFNYLPLVFERYPLDLSDFDDPNSSADGPFNFTAPVGGYRPIDYLFGDDRGAGLTPEMNHTFYGMDPATPVFAGINGVIFNIQHNQAPECDSEIFISPDSPVNPLSRTLYFDHIIPDPAIAAAFANGPVSVTPNTVIGTVGIRYEGNCNTSNAGWLEIAVVQNYPYNWWQMGDGQGMPTYSASYCPVLFMPNSSSAPSMPTRPPLTTIGPTVKRPDTSAPRIVSRTPTNGQRGVNKTAKITFKFNEKVTITEREDARVSVTRLTNQPDLRAVSGTSGKIKLSRDGKTVTVSTDTLNITDGNMYAIRIDGFLFRDLAGNAFQGINRLGDWTFMVGPTTVLPTARSYSNLRATIENQLHNVMVKYNRIASETPGYIAYTSDHLTTTYALCSSNSFGGPIVG